MPDLLNAGAVWLAAQLKAGASQTVTYRRGTSSLSGLAATIGRSDSLLTGEFGGGQLRTHDKAFIITAADLVLDGETTTPKTGDTIDITEGGVTNRYRVAPAAKGEPEFSWDPDRIALRVQTKFDRTL